MCVFVWELYFLQLQINVRCWLPGNGTIVWMQSFCGLILHRQLEESPPPLLSPGLVLPQREISWSRKDYSQVHCLKPEWEQRGGLWEETLLLSVFSLWVAWWCHRHAWNLRALGPFVFLCRVPASRASCCEQKWELGGLLTNVQSGTVLLRVRMSFMARKARIRWSLTSLHGVPGIFPRN